MAQLTEEQRKYQKEYYAKRKEEICAKKRSQYDEQKSKADKPARVKSKHYVKPKAHQALLIRKPKPTSPAKATSKVKKVDKMPRKPRHQIEDLLLARELGITVAELN